MSEAKVCPSWHKHAGTCYRHHKCRCGSCRAHMAAKSREWRLDHRIEPDPYAVDLAIDGIPTDLSIEQRTEAVHRLWLRYWSDGAIAARLGITARTVQRIRRRNGWRGYQMRELQKMEVAA